MRLMGRLAASVAGEEEQDLVGDVTGEVSDAAGTRKDLSSPMGFNGAVSDQQTFA